MASCLQKLLSLEQYMNDKAVSCHVTVKLLDVGKMQVGTEVVAELPPPDGDMLQLMDDTE